MARRGQKRGVRGFAPSSAPSPASAFLNLAKKLPPPRVSMMTAGGNLRSQLGPTDVLVSPSLVQEQVFGAVVGVVTVVGGLAPFTFSVHDELENGALWEIVGLVLKLKDDQEVFYVDAAQRLLTITVTANNGRVLVDTVTIDVAPQIVPPPPPLAPTDITLSNSSVQAAQLGAIVGTVSMIDPNLPAVTGTITVQNDGRFLVIMNPDGVTGTLQLGPTQQVPASPSTITLLLRATNSFNKFVEKQFVIMVTPVSPPVGRAHSSAFSPAFS